MMGRRLLAVLVGLVCFSSFTNDVIAEPTTNAPASEPKTSSPIASAPDEPEPTPEPTTKAAPATDAPMGGKSVDSPTVAPEPTPKPVPAVTDAPVPEPTPPPTPNPVPAVTDAPVPAGRTTPNPVPAVTDAPVPATTTPPTTKAEDTPTKKPTTKKPTTKKPTNEDDTDSPTEEPTLAPTLSTQREISNPFSLKILHMNDHHAHLGEDTLSISMETLPSEITININITDVPEVMLTYGGFPRLMTLLKDMEEKSTADAILKLHAGDVFSGTLFYTLFGGYADMKLMTPMCFDVMTLGNHDFDDGNENLETFLTNLTEATTEVCGNATQVVSANVIPPADTKLASLLLPYVIMDYDGEEVAIIGLTTKDTANVASPDEGTQFLDEITTLTATVAELEEMGINKIIAMTHVGYDVDMETISSVNGIDVIIGAHSHTLLDKNLTEFIQDNSYVPLDYHELGELLPVAGPYPTMSNDVCIVTAWCYAHGLGELDIVFDKDGVVESCNGTIKIPYDELIYEPVQSLDETFIDGFNKYLDSIEALVPYIPDSDSAAILADFQTQVDAFGSAVIADVPKGICHVRIPGEEGRSTICTPEETKDQGGGVCNLVAKAYLYEVPNADVVILNSGGCRVDIEAGDYTVDDATTLLPFSDSLWASQLTGAEIVQVLNEATKNALFGDSTGAYPYAAGLRYLVDANNEDTPVSCVEVNMRLENEWTAIDESATYTVVTGTFIAGGKDGYLTFGTLSDDKQTDLGVIDAPTFVLYCQQVGTLEDPPLDEWSTQKFTAAGNSDFGTCASSGETGGDASGSEEPGTIVDIGIANPDFSTLVAAVTAAGLVETLSGEGPFTLFAPTNEAFAALPAEVTDPLLLPENVDQLVNILKYHVVAGSFLSSSLESGDVETLNGDSVTIEVSDSGVAVNDATVTTADVIASNGVIHVIDKVLLPPSGETQGAEEEEEAEPAEEEEESEEAEPAPSSSFALSVAPMMLFTLVVLTIIL